MVLWVFALAEEVLFGATETAAVAASTAEIGPALGERHNTNTGFLGFVGMLADFAALS